MNFFQLSVQRLAIPLCLTTILSGPPLALAQSKDDCEKALIASRSLPLTKDVVIKTILALRDNGHPINHKAMERGRSPESREVIGSIVGRPFYSKTILKAGEREFGGWDKALVAAGIDPKTVRIRKPSVPLSELNLIAIVQRLNELGIPLRARAVARAGSDFEELCLREFGYSLQGDSLYAAADMYHGSWQNLMKAAGIPKDRWEPERSKWTKAQIIAAIQALQSSGVKLHIGFFRRDLEGKVKKTLLAKIGRASSGAGLYQAALVHFGGWSEALKAAGLDPSLYVIWSKKTKFGQTGEDALNEEEEDELNSISPEFRNVTDEKVIATLIRLHRASVNLFPDNFLLDDSSLTAKILEETLGVRVTTSQFYYHVKWRFWGWAEALAEAKIFLNRY